MDIFGKLKETLVSVLPIVGIVLILNFTIAPLGKLLLPFLIGAVLLILGLTLFLAGTDIGIVPVGQKLGSALLSRKKLSIVLIVGFVIGFGVTFAEPDVSVLAMNVSSMNNAINPKALVFFIAVGLGIFVDIGLFRALRSIKLKWVLIVLYCLVFVFVKLCGQMMASISFDASGATTGPLAVPFLLALGLGVSSSSKNGDNNSFGLTGVASIGPILAVSAMAVFSKSANAGTIAQSEGSAVLSLGAILLEKLKDTLIGFGPLAVMIIILQFLLLKFPAVKFRHIIFGIVYSFIGIVVFLTGVEYGFSQVGRHLGSTLSANYPYSVSLLIALIFGAIVVCAEPAVWVLTQQIEKVTAGRIKRKTVMVAICTGVACAVMLSVVRSIFSINYLYFIYFGVGLSLVLSLITPPLFVGIAFDSGGVASGPMSTSFILPFAMGFSGSAEMGFGVIGLIAISPLISIQILGLVEEAAKRRFLSAKA